MIYKPARENHLHWLRLSFQWELQHHRESILQGALFVLMTVCALVLPVISLMCFMLAFFALGLAVKQHELEDAEQHFREQWHWYTHREFAVRSMLMTRIKQLEDAKDAPPF